jgi:hypothetical protein
MRQEQLGSFTAVGQTRSFARLLWFGSNYKSSPPELYRVALISARVS